MDRITIIESTCEILNGRGNYFRIRNNNGGYYSATKSGVGVMQYDGTVAVSPIWNDVILPPKDRPAERFVLEEYKAGWAVPEYVFHLADRQGKILHQDCPGSCIGVREGIAVVKNKTIGIYCLSGSRQFPKKFYKGGPMGTDEYDYQALYHDGRLRVLDRKGRHYFIDRDGNPISKKTFLEARDFHQGVAVVGFAWLWPPRLYGTLDTDGKYILGPSYEEICDYKNHYARVQKKRKYGYIDRGGYLRIPAIWEHGQDFDDEGLAFVRNDTPTVACMIDRDGQQVVQLPTNCMETHSYSEDLLAVRAEQQRWGFVDREGHWVLTPQYLEVGDFCNGVAPVRKTYDTWAFIDRNGKEVLPVEGRLYLSEKGLAYSDHTIYNYGYIPHQQ